MFYVVYEGKTLRMSLVSVGDEGTEWEEEEVWEEEGEEFYTKEEVSAWCVRVAKQVAKGHIRGLRALKC